MNRVHFCTRTILLVTALLLGITAFTGERVYSSALSPIGVRGGDLEGEVQRIEALVDLSNREISRALIMHRTAMIEALTEAKDAFAWLHNRPSAVGCSTGYLRDYSCSQLATEALEILDSSLVSRKLWDSSHRLDVRRLENVLVTFRLYGGFDSLEQMQGSSFFAFIFGETYRHYYLKRLANAQNLFRIQYVAGVAIERKMSASFIREKSILRPLFVLSRQKNGQYDAIDYLQASADRSLQKIGKIEIGNSYIPGQGFVQLPINPFKQLESRRSGL